MAADPDDAFPDDWTRQEIKAVQALQRLAARWPDSLMLMSAAGSLIAMRIADNGDGPPPEGRFVDIHGISNDGGDPW